MRSNIEKDLLQTVSTLKYKSIAALVRSLSFKIKVKFCVCGSQTFILHPLRLRYLYFTICTLQSDIKQLCAFDSLCTHPQWIRESGPHLFLSLLMRSFHAYVHAHLHKHRLSSTLYTNTHCYTFINTVPHILIFFEYVLFISVRALCWRLCEWWVKDVAVNQHEKNILKYMKAYHSTDLQKDWMDFIDMILTETVGKMYL